MTSIPIKDLKETGKVSALCEREDDPVLVTKNGYPAFYLVKPEQLDAYRKSMAEQELYRRVDHSMQQLAEGKVSDTFKDLESMKAQYGL